MVRGLYAALCAARDEAEKACSKYADSDTDIPQLDLAEFEIAVADSTRAVVMDAAIDACSELFLKGERRFDAVVHDLVSLSETRLDAIQKEDRDSDRFGGLVEQERHSRRKAWYFVRETCLDAKLGLPPGISADDGSIELDAKTLRARGFDVPAFVPDNAMIGRDDIRLAFEDGKVVDLITGDFIVKHEGGKAYYRVTSKFDIGVDECAF